MGDIIKRTILCPDCKKQIDFYIEEHKSLKGIKIKCKCGHKMTCISESKMNTKWRGENDR